MGNKESATASRRGRPALSAEKRIAMQKQIAEVANHLFQTQGVSKISMRRIATEIGCSPMTLYKYYDNKIDILRTLWGDVFCNLFEHIESSCIEISDPKLRVNALAMAYVGYWLEHRDQYRLVFMADGVTQPDVSVFVDNPEIVAHFQIFADAIIDANQKKLELEILKLKLDALICFMNGIAHNLITISGYNWSAVEHMIATAVRSVVDA